MIYENNSRVKKTIVNTTFGLMAQMVNVVMNFVMRTVFIYTLGIQYTGVSSVFSDILTMLSLSELGVGTAIATALYEPLKYHDEDQIRKLMLFYKKAYRIIACVILIIGIGLLPFLDYLVTDIPNITEDIRLIFALYIIKTASSYLMIYKSTLLRADQKEYIVKSLETICILIRYVVEIVCLVFFRKYILYLSIEVVATIIQNYVVTNRAQKEYPFAFERSTDKLKKEEVRGLFKDIKGLAMYQISGSIGNSIDNVMISSLISTTLAGMLSNYSLIRKQIENIVKQFFTAALPSVGNLVSEKNIHKQYIIFNRLFYLSFLIVNFCATSLFVIFNPFISLWLGEEFLLGKEISFIIALDFFLYILLQEIALFRTANGMFVRGQYRPLITAVMNVFLTFLFIKIFGVFGAILATVLCRLFTQWYDPYILFRYVFKEKFRSFYAKYWFYIGLFLSGSIITNLIAEMIAPEEGVFSVLVRCILCVIVPNIWAFIFTIKTHEFNYFKGLILDKLHKVFSKK